jgi:hypothetical protein
MIASIFFIFSVSVIRPHPRSGALSNGDAKRNFAALERVKKADFIGEN